MAEEFELSPEERDRRLRQAQEIRQRRAKERRIRRGKRRWQAFMTV